MCFTSCRAPKKKESELDDVRDATSPPESFPTRLKFLLPSWAGAGLTDVVPSFSQDDRAALEIRKKQAAELKAAKDKRMSRLRLRSLVQTSVGYDARAL